MSKKFLSILNLIVLIFILWWNYYSNSGNINGNTIGNVSASVSNLFTPASYAFSIWGVIYLFLLASSIFFISRAFSDKHNDFVTIACGLLIIANLLNGLWIWFWLNESFLLSLVVMVSILLSLIMTAIKLNLEKYDAPLMELIFLFWPITIYLAWISVATIANISAYLTSIKWEAPISPLFWAFTMVAISGVLSLFVLYKRNMREFVAVVIWALIAIAVRNWNTELGLAYECLFISAVLAIENTRHAIKNKETLPNNKIKRGEW